MTRRCAVSMTWSDTWTPLLRWQHQCLDGGLGNPRLLRPAARAWRRLRFRGQHESLRHARPTCRARQADAVELAAQSFVALGVDTSVGEGALRLLEKDVLFLLQGLACSIEPRLRGGD